MMAPAIRFSVALPRRRAGGWAFAVLLAAAALPATGRAADEDEVRSLASVPVGKRVVPWMAEGTEPQCLFVPGTAIPLLAMGVRRLDDPVELRDRRLLDLWERPETSGAGSEPMRQAPLFQPLFVYDRRTADGTTWYLLGSAYAGRPLGWADGRQLHELQSRYGYHFANPKRVPPGVHLYESREAAYAALAAQGEKPPKAPMEGVLVAERLEEEFWDPLKEGAIPPFVELPDEGDAGAAFQAGLTDTTLTFPIPGENNLIHLGAVAGGPVNKDQIEKKKAEAAERAGIAIAFVIDETLSMQPYFGGIADFIDENLDLGQKDVNVKVAVSWYSDIQKRGDTPYDVHPLEPLNGPDMNEARVQEVKRQIVDTVRGHKERIIKGEGAQAQELVYPGLIAAIEKAGFEKGENAMVFVIGDAADRSEGPALAALQKRLAGLIETYGLQLAFVQVGKLGPEFADQAKAFRDSLPKERREAVIVQGAGDAPLQKRIADLQQQMERRRVALLGEIAEMETRNRYSQPGPRLEKDFSAAGLDRAAFDGAHLQFFAPAWGWRYHPQQAEATPQLRELIFVAKPESDALLPTLEEAAKGLEKGKIDMEKTRAVLAEILGKRSGHTAVGPALEAAWQALPEEDRTFGRLMHDGLGMRVRNAVLFHRGEVNPKAGPTKQAVANLRESRERIANARELGRSWVDAWKVLP